MHLVITPFQSQQPVDVAKQAFKQAVRGAAVCNRQALLWFHDIFTRQLYLQMGYASIQQFAAQEAGFSANRTAQFIRMANDLERLPPLKEAVTDGRLEWTKAQQVGRVATAETAQAWVEEAERSSRRELAQGIKAARLGQEVLPLGAAEAPPPAPRSVRVHLNLAFDSLDAARIEAMIEAAKKAGLVPATATREEVFAVALQALVDDGQGVRRRNENAAEGRQSANRAVSAAPYQVILYRCDHCASTEVVTRSGRKPVDEATAEAAYENASIHTGGRNRHEVPPALRLKIFARDRHRCQAPGCAATRFLEVHHVLPRAQGGTNHPDNLRTLCSRCHRYAHRPPTRRTSPLTLGISP